MREVEELLQNRFEWETEQVRTDEGWDFLVLELHRLLFAINPDYKLFQVKQKFGGLRYYATYEPTGDDEHDEVYRRIFDNLIGYAETRSTSMCEVCGTFGRIVIRDYYYRTLCGTHAKEMGFSER